MEDNFLLDEILPHKKPMILIDELINVDLEKLSAKTKVKIDENKIFYDKTLNGIDHLAGIEFMAQTIGCYAFYKNGKKRPKAGFLLGTRNFKSGINYFKKNEVYEIEIKELFMDDELVSFECFIYNNGKECQKAVVNVYQPKDDKVDLLRMYG